MDLMQATQLTEKIRENVAKVIVGQRQAMDLMLAALLARGHVLLEDVPGVAYKLFSVLAKGKINVDMIIQSLGRDEMKDIVFTVAEKDVMDCAKLLDANKDTLSFDHMDINTGVAKVSIVGAGMLENVGIAAKMFEALYQQHINIHMISTSEVKISVLIDKDDSDRAVRVLHNQFFQ